ncbi:hypothetical protein [Sphingomonas humi]|uniref:Uncharacterized protein n=1 Tax=Sphingomonas humi TaxID=335630 RepID=A0ABP7RXS6_9SPHN
MTTASRARVANDPLSLARLEDLLIRYPAVSADEKLEIGTLLHRTGPLDMGLLSANAAAWPQAERYRRDHPARFRMGWRQRLFWSLTGVLVIAALILAWDIGIG